MTANSIIGKFDDLFRCQKELTLGSAEEVFYLFLQQYEVIKLDYQKLLDEAKDLQIKLDIQTQATINHEQQLNHARKLLEREHKARREAEAERDVIEQKIVTLRDMLLHENTIKDETRRQIAALNNYTKKRKSTHIIRDNEINSTGSFLSEMSLTQSEDDFLESRLSTQPQKWKRHRSSINNNNSFLNVNASGKKTRVSMENRRSTRQSLLEYGPNDKIVASTKVHIPADKRKPICAESVIESIPQAPQAPIPQTPTTSSLSSEPKEIQTQFKTPKRRAPMEPVFSNKKYYTPSAPSLDDLDQIADNKEKEVVYATVIKKKPSIRIERQHTMTSKTFLKPESCAVCQRRIRFGSMGLKCSSCRTCTHQDCKDNLKTPCIPQSASTPNNKPGVMGTISDYTPNVAPMVPALIVLCVNEVEARGLTEVGLYRVSGAERDVKALKERFLRNKGAPCLASVDVHVLCGCIKDFLRSLKEPLIPMSLWATFSNAADIVTACQNDSDGYQEMYKAINMLPQPNRDTLAYLIQHFQRIAECTEVKMPLSNFAKIFGPTLVGYSCPDPEQNKMFAETQVQFCVMTCLLNIPTDYWNQFVNLEVQEKPKPSDQIESYGNKFYSGTPSMRVNRKERKFYATPPYPRKK